MVGSLYGMPRHLTGPRIGPVKGTLLPFSNCRSTIGLAP
jgi:hypothetical protein